uniref:Uncharacterized protein n=1 Tax=Schistosoma haematobium TaxID=6185 RepID=A0A095A4C6_SCHHA
MMIFIRYQLSFYPSMHIDIVYSRKRRNVLTKTQEDEINMEKSLIDNGNESFSAESIETVQSSSSSSSTPKIPVIQFRRLQKEITNFVASFVSLLQFTMSTSDRHDSYMGKGRTD